MKQRTDLETLYTDGGYCSPAVDQALQEHQVQNIPTAIKGRKPDQDKFGLANYVFTVDEQGNPTHLTCPYGQLASIRLGPKKGALLADFDPDQCKICPFHLSGQCRAKPGKRDTRFHLDFNHHETQVARRRQAMEQQKLSGHNYRAAVEATMRSLKHAFPGGKLPVRGLFRMTCMLIGAAMMTNVRRIHAYSTSKNDLKHSFSISFFTGPVFVSDFSLQSPTFFRELTKIKKQKRKK